LLHQALHLRRAVGRGGTARWPKVAGENTDFKAKQSAHYQQQGSKKIYFAMPGGVQEPHKLAIKKALADCRRKGAAQPARAG
jgi:hypothetical protein